MKLNLLLLCVAGLLVVSAGAAQPALTIYNQEFAVVRDTVPLDLKAGVNQVQFVGTTAYLEPSSVVLRDPAGKHPLVILEQNYRGDPVSQESLLTLNEGKTIQFEVVSAEGNRVRRELVSGKIIRSGYGIPRGTANPYGYMPYADAAQPVIEVNGKLQFSLPGLPIFPALADDTILKPTLVWLIETDQPAKFIAELSYVTGGFTWQSDYNLVLPEQGDTLDMVGWVTMDNQSGNSFKDARIKLMAGDVNKIRDFGGYHRQLAVAGGFGGGGAVQPQVTEKAFDEYHLYTLERATTLHDHEKKQVEFVKASGVNSTTIYVYDGVSPEPYFFIAEGLHTEGEYGVQCNKKVWVMREFTNSVANHLGLPLPKGKVRIYRHNTDGQMEFTGENLIDHTPRDEVVRLTTGIAFDLVGERKRTDFRVKFSRNDSSNVNPVTGVPEPSGTATAGPPPPWIDESFEITLRNHKQAPVEIRVVEHLYRWSTWEIKEKSRDFKKTDAQTIEFRVPLKPDEEQTVSYTVHYSW